VDPGFSWYLPAQFCVGGFVVFFFFEELAKEGIYREGFSYP
jgi:5-methylthioribose kinase